MLYPHHRIYEKTRSPRGQQRSLRCFLTLFSPLLHALLRKRSLAKYKVSLSKRSDALTQTQLLAFGSKLQMYLAQGQLMQRLLKFFDLAV